MKVYTWVTAEKWPLHHFKSNIRTNVCIFLQLTIDIILHQAVGERYSTIWHTCMSSCPVIRSTNVTMAHNYTVFI